MGQEGGYVMESIEFGFPSANCEEGTLGSPDNFRYVSNWETCEWSTPTDPVAHYVRGNARDADGKQTQSCVCTIGSEDPCEGLKTSKAKKCDKCHKPNKKGKSKCDKKKVPKKC